MHMQNYLQSCYDIEVEAMKTLGKGVDSVIPFVQIPWKNYIPFKDIEPVMPGKKRINYVRPKYFWMPPVQTQDEEM